jgi:hypothetical protein
MRSALLASILTLLATAVACGDSEGAIDVGENTGGRPSDDDRPGDSGIGFSGRGGGETDASVDGGGVDPAAPQIEMLAPAAADDPNDDEILTALSVKVRCRVTKSQAMDARDVDRSSVRIRMISLDMPMEIAEAVVAPSTDNESEFEAEFPLDEVANHALRFSCEASDVGSPKLTGSASVDTFLDLGPTVSILEPEDGSIHSLIGIKIITFEVRNAPVSADDEEADLTDVTLHVLGMPFEATPDPVEPGRYRVEVDFNDRELFAMAPTAVDIVVTAASSRTPIAPIRRAEVHIELDALGPAIAIASPRESAIVRSPVELVVSITDDSGVDFDTVRGDIELVDPFPLESWTVNRSTYRTQFDTTATIFDSFTQLTINITAKDNVGNEAEASLTIYLDDVPPIVSLDPPHVREYYETANIKYCSSAFDPVGIDAANDEGPALPATMFRALVFERTRGVLGQNVLYLAGVNPSSVVLYAQTDRDIPLLIDTNGDGTCDEINSDASPEPVLLQLSAVAKRGSAYYAAMPNFQDPLNIAASDCTASNGTTPPEPLCDSTEMFRVIPQWIEGGPNAIYALDPQQGSGLACDGNTWQIGAFADDGWLCLAARAEDNIGNVGISPPIRVCFDDFQGPPPSCTDPMLDPPPTCGVDVLGVSGCRPPPDLPADLTLKRR